MKKIVLFLSLAFVLIFSSAKAANTANNDYFVVKKSGTVTLIIYGETNGKTDFVVETYNNPTIMELASIGLPEEVLNACIAKGDAIYDSRVDVLQKESEFQGNKIKILSATAAILGFMLLVLSIKMKFIKGRDDELPEIIDNSRNRYEAPKKEYLRS